MSNKIEIFYSENNFAEDLKKIEENGEYQIELTYEPNLEEQTQRPIPVVNPSTILEYTSVGAAGGPDWQVSKELFSITIFGLKWVASNIAWDLIKKTYEIIKRKTRKSEGSLAIVTDQFPNAAQTIVFILTTDFSDDQLKQAINQLQDSREGAEQRKEKYIEFEYKNEK